MATATAKIKAVSQIQFKIEDDVPAPKTPNRTPVQWPFDSMKKGSSVQISKDVRSFFVVKRACIQWNKEKGSAEKGRLVYRKLADRNSRVWKV